VLAENNTTNQFIKNLAQREGVAEEKIKKIIIGSFHKSYCRGENTQVDLHFEFEAGLTVYRAYQIVEKVSNPEKEIARADKLLKKGQVKDDKF
ncbi:5011_t:CDS:1, partial [Ambispora gerdemannii]